MAGIMQDPMRTAREFNEEASSPLIVSIEDADEVAIEIEEKGGIEQEDGSLFIPDEVEEEAPDLSTMGFYDNLATALPEAYLTDTANNLIDAIEEDRKAREKRDKQQEEGIRRTGLGNDAPGGAEFSGASRVVHPGMAEACVDFAARAIKELYPVNGPVRIKIPGTADKQRLKRAERKARHMNHQLTQEIREYRGELEQTLTQLPLGGSQYLYWWFDAQYRRARCEFVPIDDVFLPAAAANFESSDRKTRRLRLTEFQVKNRIRRGIYRDIELSPPGEMLDGEHESDSAKANLKIEGKEETGKNVDSVRIVYDVWVTMECPDDPMCGDGEVAPYIITIDEATKKILQWRRNWEKTDERRQEMTWMVEFQFIPWRGAYSIGFPQLIGGMSAAATGALRALLDSAHISNAPTLLKLKGAKIGGQSQEVAVTQVTEVDGGIAATDIRQIAMPMPFNPPSQVLFQLLGFLDGQMRGVVRTSLDNTQVDSNTNTPVGTQLARVEQGMMVFSAIHSRLHEAQHRCLMVLHRINKMYLDQPVTIGDEVIITPEEYQGEMDVIPVSDPSIFSELQRYGQMTAIEQIDAQNPGLVNKVEKVRRQLELLKIPNPDALLAVPPEPTLADPITENVAMASGKPVEVFPENDDMAHIQAHVAFFQSPLLGGSPVVQQAFVPAFVQHIQKHLIQAYQKGASAAAQQTGQMAAMGMAPQMSPDQIAAQATTAMVQMAGQDQNMAQIAAVMQQAMQFVSQMQENSPQNLAIQIEKIRAESRNQTEQIKAEAKINEANINAQLKSAETRLEQTAIALEAERQKREEVADQIERDRQWFLEQNKAATAERKAELDRAQQQFENNLAARQQVFDERIKALEMQLATSKQSLEEFKAQAQAALAREEATRDRIELANTIATTVANTVPKPAKSRRVNLEKGADGSLSAATIVEGE